MYCISLRVGEGGWMDKRVLVVWAEWMNRLHNGVWITFISLFYASFLSFTFISIFLSSLGSFLFFLTEDEKNPTHVFCLQLPPIPHFSFTPFCTATHILRTGLYIVFEKISECLCLHLLLNKCVGLLPAYLCVWMSTMTTIVCVSVCVPVCVYSVGLCSNRGA